jgi:hypothetical protein
MRIPDQTSPKRKTYVKPQVTKVQLVAQEAVLGDCKDSIGGQSLCQAIGNLTCLNAGQTS